MRGINRVTLLGNLGRDPEQKILDSGVPVAKMALATTEIYRLKDGSPHAQTEWHRVIVWRGLATLAARYLRKGSLVYIEGKICYRVFEDGEGQRRQVTEILADRLLMLDKKPTASFFAENGGDEISDLPPF